MNKYELAAKIGDLAEEAGESYAAVVLLALAGAVMIGLERELADVCVLVSQRQKDFCDRSLKAKDN
jgi:hypothetical protein